MISRDLSKKILTIGVYFKNNAPGGMASVVATYDDYFENFRYISTWRWSNKFVKLYYAFKSIILFAILMLFDRRIKIVHIHGAAHNSFFRKKLFIDLGYAFNKKIIYHIHASQFKVFFEESDKKETILKTILKVDKLIVLSTSWAEYFMDKGIPKSKITILNNIVPTPTILQEKSTNGKVNFLFMGEIGDRKGIFDLLTAIAKNKELFQEKMHLRIGGNGEIDRLNDFIKKQNLDEIVIFLGWVSGSKKIDELNNTDIYILPSHNEGLPISILEALSYRRPIISTPVGGIAEVVIPNKNGILVEPGNVDQIKKSLLFFIENKDCINTYGINSEKIVSRFYPDAVMNDLNCIYSELLNS